MKKSIDPNDDNHQRRDFHRQSRYGEQRHTCCIRWPNARKQSCERNKESNGKNYATKRIEGD